MIAALAGLAAGATHALTGPDHVAAVLPLAAEAPRRALRLGLTWAAGHGVGTVALASFVLVLRAQLDLEGVGARLEVLVGVALVIAGGWALLRARAPGPRTDHHGLGVALGIGTLHGLAGGAHVLVALSAVALPTWAAVSWIGAFVVGAALAMGAVGWGLTRVAGGWGDATLRRAQVGAGTLAIVVGVVWAGLALA